jgi:YHS domain-containing protein
MKDVVCGMDVDEKEARSRGLVTERQRLVTERQGDVDRFCSEECQRRFESDPARYTMPADGPTAPDGKTAERYSG